MRPFSNMLSKAFCISVCCLSPVLVADRGECQERENIPPTKPSGNVEFDHVVQETEKLLTENASLATILKHPDKSVAVTACWAYYNSPKLHGQLIDYHHLMKARKRFVGYLSATIQQIPPDWWEESLIKESLEFNDSSREEYAYHMVQVSGSKTLKYDSNFRIELKKYKDLFLPEHASVDESNQDHFVLNNIDQNRILISPAVMQGISRSDLLLKGFALKEGSVLVLYEPGRARNLKIYRLNDKGELKWKTGLWGTGLAKSNRIYKLGRRGGFDRNGSKTDEFQYLEGVESEGRIAIYGADYTGAYVESFDLNSGEVILRFSTVSVK